MKLDHTAPSLDGTLDVLADAQRRTVLRFLSDQSDNVASIEDLIRHLDTQEQTTGEEEATTPAQIETDLHHRHFPKLEEQGLVEYDLRSGQIRYNPDKSTEELLQVVRHL
jgi:DNA-binding transcriptional ArsR family regulator